MRNKLKNKNAIAINIIKSINVVMILENICGIFRYRLEDGQLMPIRRITRIYGIIRMIVLTSAYFVIFFYSYSVIQVKLYGPDIKIAFSQMLPISTFIILYVTSTILLDRGRKCIRLFQVLARIDEALYISTDVEFYERTRRNVSIALCVFLIGWVSACLPDYQQVEDDPEVKYYGILCTTLIVIIDCVRHFQILAFYTFVKVVVDRLEVMNKYLTIFVDLRQNKLVYKNILKANLRKKANYFGPVSANNTKVRELTAAYNDIGEATDLINDIYKFQIFSRLIVVFIFVIIMMWKSIYTYKLLETSDLLGTVVQLTLETISIGYMCYVCELLTRKRHVTKKLVNELVMDYELPREMRMQAKAFMEMIGAWQLKVYAYDMFAIDLGLILKFISVATTYLIVIIQISHLL